MFPSYRRLLASSSPFGNHPTRYVKVPFVSSATRFVCAHETKATCWPSALLAGLHMLPAFASSSVELTSTRSVVSAITITDVDMGVAVGVARNGIRREDENATYRPSRTDRAVEGLHPIPLDALIVS